MRPFNRPGQRCGSPARRRQNRHRPGSASEVPGYMKRTELNDEWSPRASLRCTTRTSSLFERTLAPQETFTSAGVSVLSINAAHLPIPHWRIPSYVRDRIAYDKQRGAPEWIYNTWEPWHTTINSKLMKGLIAKAGADGFTLLTLDDGWEQLYGETRWIAESLSRRFGAGLHSGRFSRLRSGAMGPGRS